MKVTHVIIGLNVGGAEMMLKRLIDAHKHRPDIEHSVISLTDQGVLGRQLENIGVEVHCLGASSVFNIPMSFFKLFKLLRFLRPDVVQCWMYHADLIGGLAARAVGVKRVLWGIRNSELQGGGTLVKKMLRKVCAALSWFVPDEIICVASSALDTHKRVGYRANIMKVIPNGYDTSVFCFSLERRIKYRAKIGCGDLILVGSVGRYCEAKNHKLFIDAALHALAKNENLFFVVVGKGVDCPELDSYISSLGLSNRFALLGAKEDVSGYMSAMDIFCLHSNTEGFPNVLGEAMSVGVACISTDVGDAAYLLGGTGTLIPKENDLALANAIVELSCLGADERSSLGLKARDRICERFALENTVAEFEKSYQ